MEAQIETLYQPLFLYVRKRIQNREDAEDLTQDVFYKLSKSDTEKIHNVKHWVYTIARNTITDYYRKKKMYTEEVGEDIVEMPAEDEDVATELSRCIAAYIAQLPEAYRNLITLSELEEVPQKEIAAQLNLNYATVRSKVQRGRQKLKEIFTDCCNFKQGGKGSILSYERRNPCPPSSCDSAKKSDC